MGLAWIGVASADRGLFGPLVAGKGLSWLLVAFGFGMVGHLAWRLLRDRAGDLVEARRGARVLVVVLLGGLLFVDLSVDVLLGLDWRPRWFAVSENVAILAFTLWLSARLLRGDTAALTFEQPRPASSRVAIVAAGPAEARLHERLRVLVEIERVHLDPALSFAAFVRRMGAPERAVRQLINRELGHDHFRAFLNAQRMDEARRRLADPAHGQDKLIAIAQDSGFSSLASFNRVFRASEACTPSQFRQASLSPDDPRNSPSEEPLAVF